MICARSYGSRLRLKIKGKDYPGVLEGNGTVEGVVRFKVDDEDVLRLDTFEGPSYKRIEEVVIDSDGNHLKVDIYKSRDDCKTILEDSEWAVGHFERTGLQRFIVNYEGFRGIR